MPVINIVIEQDPVDGYWAYTEESEFIAVAFKKTRQEALDTVNQQIKNLTGHNYWEYSIKIREEHEEVQRQ